MANEARIIVEDKEYTCPIITGTEGEKAVDIRALRGDSGYVTFDEGYANTGSCQSNITFIDGEKGILRYRGYPIEELAEHSTFVETAYLIIYGELPTCEQVEAFSSRLARNAAVPNDMEHFFEGYPAKSHPMAILSGLINSLSCFYPQYATNNHQEDLANFDEVAAAALSQVRTIAAMSYRMSQRLPYIYPKKDLRYVENFLHMMFSEPYSEYIPEPEVSKALNLILLLHADHEQNCSTSTVRMVASSEANLFASVAAGVCALWGPLHGGANMAVINMLEAIHADGDDGSTFIADAKTGRKKLMGFGHRVYKNYDPRAKIIGKACERVMNNLGVEDPLLDIAKHLEEVALQDDYFISRKLYPNVDFYSGIIMRVIGIPINMFTVMFGIGRMPGWIANWKEVAEHPNGRIYRPRQIYVGENQRKYVPRDQR